MLPCPMRSAPTLIYPEASVADSPLLSGGPSHSCGAVRIRYIAFDPAYSQSSLPLTMDHAITTPLFLITSLQPLCFHMIAHSFKQRRSAIRRAFNNLHTLSIATGGGTPRNSYSSLLRLCVSVSLWQIPCSQQLAASYSALFRAPFLCFQSFAASFSKTPGAGGTCPSSQPSDVPAFRRFDFQTVRRAIRSVTWTWSAHPTIIAASSRFQVHG